MVSPKRSPAVFSPRFLCPIVGNFRNFFKITNLEQRNFENDRWLDVVARCRQVVEFIILENSDKGHDFEIFLFFLINIVRRVYHRIIFFVLNQRGTCTSEISFFASLAKKFFGFGYRQIIIFFFFFSRS